MKFSLEYSSTAFFLDLLALSLLLLPIYLVASGTRTRQVTLILSGLYLLLFIAPRLALLSLFFWLLVFAMQRLIANLENKAQEKPDISSLVLFVFIAAVLGTLTPMLWWKTQEWEFVKLINLSGNSALSLFSRTLWEIDLARNIIMPVGLSFATFRAVDLLVKTYIGKFRAMSLREVFYYGFFPPVLVVGPIIEYEEIKEGASGKLPAPKSDDFLAGALRTAWGFFKVLFLASLLQPSAQILDTFNTQSVSTIWIYLFVYTWFFYINFSGYSDIAIGIARLYGFKLKENFNNPFFARNIIEFWSSWHMSLYRFARRNVFVPLGGYRENRHLYALAGTMMTIALWHALSASMVTFGIYHTIGLILHRLFTKWKDRNNISLDHPAAQLACLLFTYLFVMLSFPLIVLPLGTALEFYGSMFGMGG